MSRRAPRTRLLGPSSRPIGLFEWLEDRRMMANVTWTNGAGGNLWGTAGNWDPAGVPTAMDTAIFSGAGDLARLDANHRVKEVHATAGAATIDLKNLKLSADAKLIVRNGVLTIENSSFAEGTGLVAGPIVVDPELGVPREMPVPQVLVEKDGTLITKGTLAAGPKTGLIVNALTVGDDGTGSLDIRTGSSVNSQSAVVGKNATGIAKVGDAVDVAIGQWLNSGDMVIGDAGTGTLLIGKSGTVQVDKTLTAGEQLGSSGTITVKLFLSTKDITIVSDSGAGQLDIQSASSPAGLIPFGAVTNGAILGKTNTGGAVEGKVNVPAEGKWLVGSVAADGELTFSTLAIGQGGKGTLNADDGDIVSGYVVIGEAATGRGTAVIKNGAAWSIEDALVVGKAGDDAKLTVDGGSEVDAAAPIDVGLGEMGMAVGKNAHVEVLNASTLKSEGGGITIGKHGTGAVVDVHTGSLLQSGEDGAGGALPIINESGTIKVTGATVRASPMGKAGGGLLWNKPNGSLRPGAGAVLDANVKNDGKVAGTGTVKGWLVNHGSYYPGFEESIGTGTVEDYFVNSGVLYADIDGGNDHVAVSGYATVGGSLVASLWNNYVPTPWTATGISGDWFPILSAGGSLTGEFAPNLPDIGTLDLPPLTIGTHYEWVVVYDRDDVTPDPFLVETHQSFASQPWLGNGTHDVVLVIREVPYQGTEPEQYEVGSNRNDELEVLAPGVLGNDYHVDVAALHPNSGPYHGTLTFHADGSFEYVADPGYEGTDTFQYVATNTLRQVSSPPETVTITVTYMEPSATDDEYWLDTDSDPSLTVTAPGVLMNESYADTAVLVPNSGPSHGTLNLNPDGSFTYTPYTAFTGDDTFQYRAKDSYTGYESQPATVTIHVSCVWCSPLMLDRPAIDDAGAKSLRGVDFGPLGREAVRRWREAGVDQETLDGRLMNLQFVVLDLPGSQLAMANERNGTIVIDINAAGYGWFLDATPSSDDEFAIWTTRSERRAERGSAAASRVDLLTALEHEIGHLLGLDHSEVAGTGNVMDDTLSLGTRRLPTALDAAAADFLYSIWQAERRRQAG